LNIPRVVIMANIIHIALGKALATIHHDDIAKLQELILSIVKPHNESTEATWTELRKLKVENDKEEEAIKMAEKDIILRKKDLNQAKQTYKEGDIMVKSKEHAFEQEIIYKLESLNINEYYDRRVFVQSLTEAQAEIKSKNGIKK